MDVHDFYGGDKRTRKARCETEERAALRKKRRMENITLKEMREKAKYEKDSKLEILVSENFFPFFTREFLVWHYESLIVIQLDVVRAIHLHFREISRESGARISTLQSFIAPLVGQFAGVRARRSA